MTNEELKQNGLKLLNIKDQLGLARSSIDLLAMVKDDDVFRTSVLLHLEQLSDAIGWLVHDIDQIASDLLQAEEKNHDR